MLRESGVTSMDSSAAGVTVKVAVFEVMPDAVAVIDVVPVLTELARPRVLMVAMPVFDECHSAVDEMSCVLVSEKVPTAVNCWVLPRAMIGLVGLTAIAVITASVTVSIAVEETIESNDAVMDEVPSLTAVASPFDPAALLIVATGVIDDSQVAHEVKVWAAPSVRVPVAANCFVVPFARVAEVGVSKILATGEEMSVAVPVMPE